MLIAIIVLAYLLLMSLIEIVITGNDDGYSASNFLAAFMFIFLFPAWALVKFIFFLRTKVHLRRVRCKKHKQDQERRKQSAE